MAYPVLKANYGGSVTPSTGRVMDRSTNGAICGRSFYSAPKRTFKFTHELTPSELTTFRDFWLNNLYNSFTYVWPGDGQTYTVAFLSDPAETPTPYGTNVSVELGEA